MGANSPEAAVYQLFMRNMITTSLSEKLGDLTVRYAGKGPTPGLAEGSYFGFTAWVWLEKTLADANSHWFDLGNGKTRDDVMRLALKKSVDFLKSENGPEPQDWAWGKLHKLSYSHVMGQVKPLDKLFNRGPFALNGDGTTISMGHTTLHNLDNPVVIGPVFRFIADMGDPSRSLGLITPGQSGQPGSRHYDDQLQAWDKWEYHPMLFSREDVEREVEATLTLLPD
jgi:penicillin amidase